MDVLLTMMMIIAASDLKAIDLEVSTLIVPTSERFFET